MKKYLIYITLVLFLISAHTAFAFTFGSNLQETLADSASNPFGTLVPVTNTSIPQNATAFPLSNSNTTNGNLGYTPLEPIPGLTSNPDLTNPGNLPVIINAIFKVLITVGALLAVLMLTVGGIQYMTSGSAGEKNIGIKRAQAALWGIVLIAAAWLILYTINPALLNFTLNPCPDGVNCTITAATPTTPTVSPACGSSYPNGCGTNQYCGAYVDNTLGTDGIDYGSSVTTCLSNTNQSANQSCTTAGGTWTQGVNSTYCYLPSYTNSQSCTGAGHQWDAWGVPLGYCYQ